MPVLESTDNLTPRSALRHRPLDERSGSSVAASLQPSVQRASRAHPIIAEDELVTEWQRGDLDKQTKSVPVTRPKQSPRNTDQPRVKKLPRTTAHIPAQRLTKLRLHPVLFLGLGMLLMVLLWTTLTAGINWWNNTLDYIHYGYPRTFQTDAVVGHKDSAQNPSHFIALNLHGRIEIIEFPGGDASHARIYLGPQLFDSLADTTPVTVQFADVNGDHKPDMLVFFASSWIVFINADGGFRTPTDQEHLDAASYLAAHGQ